MKQLFAAACVAASLASVFIVSPAQVAAAPHRAGVAVSPELLPDRRVTFSVTAPEAHEVSLTCECTPDPVLMRKDGKGNWRVTIGPVEAGFYEYDIWIDGEQVIDPSNQAAKDDNQPTPLSSLLQVPGPGEVFHDHQPMAHGSVAARSYSSNATGTTRRMHVYVPPGYGRSGAKLPVLYLLHGAGDDDSSWTRAGHANLILDRLLAERKAVPMVVVMPDGYAYPRGDGVPGAQQRADFESDLLEEIIPFIQANYRVVADRDHRALVGLSMGGGQALNIGLHHLDLFSRIAGFSAGASRSSPGGPFADVLSDPGRVNRSLKLLWLGCGDEDDLFAPNQALSALLTSGGIAHTFFPSSGGHTWSNWRKYLAEVAPKLWN